MEPPSLDSRWTLTCATGPLADLPDTRHQTTDQKVHPRTTTHRRRRGTGRGTGDLEILRFWVQWWHSRVASVQVAGTKPGSVPLVMRCLESQHPLPPPCTKIIFLMKASGA